LMTSQEKKDGYVATIYAEDFVGRQGTANTILRPSGRIEIEGEVYDAYTRGEYVEAGERVVVISQEGSTLKVRVVK